ncbi:hypothetical protein IMG5_090970 [Ichthyophthirius multifiliis]|uniref:Coatomer subunit delta n=1 Tax=Ichthyophthirius multifiliis TaxID=5932 RepID=G0QR96_ICHMU|nr:hypothetical protein IMG5_090970 [Ichthyophthirius multifiliis]EGR32248.1 hypothetical protein IMG5_090970 [Ichthyophthirius multifiliis]|eukprot:XP_004035734.1 hypothetical protein IMG5_090970 [Ichthyophthirius multifiliis]
MVIISAVICDKQGSILVARQYQNISKHQLEENIRNFPKLIQQDQQHTFVETEYMRYVYLPLDTMYLVLLTKKNSNIIENQETIRLLHKILQDLCPQGVSEANILKRDFDILLCFDDVISYGLRESVTLAQVQTSLDMESSEEKLHNMLMKQRIAEQKEQAKKYQQELKKKQQDKNFTSSSASNPYGSVSSTNQSNIRFPSKSIEEVLKPDLSSDKIDNTQPARPSQKPTTNAPKKGMALGKKQPKNEQQDKTQPKQQQELIQQIQEESNQQQEIKLNPLKAPIDIEIVEKLSCQMTREGTLNSLEINGEVFLSFYDPSKSKVVIQFEYDQNVKLNLMKPHINLNKQLWQDKKQIVLKNSDQSFPLNSRIPSVKYRYVSNSQNEIPFNITCWFSEGGSIALETEFNQDSQFINLKNIEVCFNYPSGEQPSVTQSENADYQIENKSNLFKYIIPVINSDVPSSNIQIQFSANVQEDELFPFNVYFQLSGTYLNIKPLAIANLDDNKNLVKFDIDIV